MPDGITTAYLDTSAWNAVLDAAGPDWRPPSGQPTILFSSCNLDQFVCADDATGQALSAFAWDVSNRQKLLDHLELTTLEILSHIVGRELGEPFDDDPGFALGWLHLRLGTTPPAMLPAMRDQILAAKLEVREHLRDGRKAMGPFLRKASAEGFKLDWKQFLVDVERDPQLANLIGTELAWAGLLRLIPDPDALHGIPFWSLPGTAAWIQYRIALNYAACHETGRMSRPDLGDQVDTRHAAYAGVADLFVSGDERMRWVLKERMLNVRAEVLPPDEFLARFAA